MGRRLLLTLLALAALALTACGEEDTDPRVRAVDKGDATLIDVRTQREWDGGHAKHAVLLPHEDVKRGARPDVAKDRTVLVYCRSGRRAAEVATILERDGWTDVRAIGGLKDWEQAGGELAPAAG
jgi:rhodanese-related sulfurtransferase